MADNVDITPGTGATVAADDVSGVLYQRIKVAFGADGAATDVATGAPFPVVQTGALPAGDNNIGNVDIVTLPALASGTNNIGDVDIVGGTVAHDAAGTSINPLLPGAIAKATDGTTPGSVSAEDDLTYLKSTLDGRLLVSNAHPFAWSATENNAAAQTNNELKAAPGASLSLYITDIIVSNGATAGSIRLVEDTAGTPAIVLQEMYLAINGGAHLKLQTPIRITANKNVGFTSTTVTTHSVTLLGYTAP